ncbi:hypothetical protein [Neisseria lactamica]|uniref:hypothetical protein n=1 Tax=Neisseria lactamica TaxID=486 RepID=UPI0027DFAB02|nr:hypothetical protein [Neisseria lactamica]
MGCRVGVGWASAHQLHQSHKIHQCYQLHHIHQSRQSHKIYQCYQIHQSRRFRQFQPRPPVCRHPPIPPKTFAGLAASVG